MSETEFQTIVVSQYSFIQMLAYKISGDRELASDLTQETMYKAFKNRNSFKMGTNVKGWLYTILRNTFINVYRKDKKRKTFVDQTDNQFFIDSGRTSPDPADGQANVNDLTKAIEQLEYNLKEPFKRYFQGYKYDEIAEEMNIPLGTVKSRIFKARKKLQFALKDDRY